MSAASITLPAAKVASRRRILRPALVLASLYLIWLLLAALYPSLFTSHSPTKQDLSNSLAKPFSGSGFLGTDEVGRDVWARLVYSCRVAVRAAVQSVAIAVVIGVPLGILTGYLRGRVGEWLMRLNDVLMSFPALLFALTLVAVLGPGLNNAMIAIGIIFIPTYVRLVRGIVLDVREHDYVAASRSIGSSPWLVVHRHILRAIAPALLVQLSLSAGFAMLAEASLSFLGLGVQLPNPSWGLMMSRGIKLMDRAPWLVIWPGIALTLAVLSLNVVGDALRRKFLRSSQ